jgi:colanic acid biosynthesis protein WcaH
VTDAHARQPLIEALEATLDSPRTGLPEDVFQFVSRLTPLINVDLLITDDRSRTLLTWRDDEFFDAGWHVPGSIIRYKETMADRIRACAREELGAAVAWDEAPLLVSEGMLAQVTRGHLIALLFRCRLLNDPAEHLRADSDSPKPGEWRWHDRCPPNLIDVQKPYARFL